LSLKIFSDGDAERIIHAGGAAGQHVNECLLPAPRAPTKTIASAATAATHFEFMIIIPPETAAKLDGARSGVNLCHRPTGLRKSAVRAGARDAGHAQDGSEPD